MSSKPFTPEEDAWLRKHYADHTYKQMSEALGRPVNSINSRLAKLKLKNKIDRWSAEEDALLRENYLEHTVKELAQELGRKPVAVRDRIARLGLQKYNRQSERRERWTAAEDQRLRDAWGRHSSVRIAAEMGRTVHAVEQRASRLGITRQETNVPDAEASPSARDAILLPEICRTCRWREKFETGDSLPRAQFTRWNSCCGFALHNERCRSGNPTEDGCPEYEKL